MQISPPYPREDQRLLELEALDIMDSDPEQAYDDVTHLAAHIAGCEYALITLVDDCRQWFKARHGVPFYETARDIAFCTHSFVAPHDYERDLMVVPDALQDERFHDNPLVIHEPRIRFYAGATLYGPLAGEPLGALCVLSRRPQQLKLLQRQLLQTLARQVEHLLAARIHLRLLEERNVEQERLRKTLEAARSEAEAATQAKSLFLAVMTHEIRTPLTAIVGSIQLLEDLELPPEARDHAQVIRGCSETLLTLIGEILDFSKIEARQIELAEEVVDLADLAESSLVNVDGQVRDKDLLALWSIEPDLPQTVLGDAGRLRQILCNLLGNAVKFTAAGSVELRLRPGVDATLAMEVVDTGIGVSSETRDHLFRPFEQADISIARQYGGSGLGLAISRQLAELMDGSLGLEASGTSTCFVLRLPLRPAESQAPQASAVACDCSALPPRIAAHVHSVLRALRAPHATALRARWEDATVILEGPGIDPPLRLHPPLRRSHVARALWPQAPDPSPPPPQPAATPGLRVLVAEDDPITQHVIRLLLESLGCSVTTVADGRAAVAAVAAGNHDLVFLDLHMPLMDGVTAAHEIRNQGHGLPLVALTGSACRDDHLAFRQAGLAEILVKPVTRNQLRDVLDSLFPAPHDHPAPDRLAPPTASRRPLP